MKTYNNFEEFILNFDFKKNTNQIGRIKTNINISNSYTNDNISLLKIYEIKSYYISEILFSNNIPYSILLVLN